MDTNLYNSYVYDVSITLCLVLSLGTVAIAIEEHTTSTPLLVAWRLSVRGGIPRRAVTQRVVLGSVVCLHQETILVYQALRGATECYGAPRRHVLFPDATAGQVLTSGRS